MGIRRRAPTSGKRTYIPVEYLQLLGNRIRLALQDEHVAFNQKRKQRVRFSTERACTATGIPYQTMLTYLQGKRVPSILDMREIEEFTGVSFSALMQVIPSRKQLDRLLDEEEARVRQEALKSRRQAESGAGSDGGYEEEEEDE